MIVNRSLYPVQTGFSVISKMQETMSTLQTQLGTGQKSSTLAGMGNDLPMSLSVRSRLNKIDGYSSNIDTVNLRLSFLDNVMSRFDTIEGETRNSAIQGQYGTDTINMATLPDLSKARFDEVVTMLNSDVAGRYLFGGSITDKQPLPDTTTLLDGAGAGKAGFKTVVSERKLADAGVSGMGRLTTSVSAGTVKLTEDGVHPFGFKVSSSSSSNPTSVTVTGPTAATLPAGDSLSIAFKPLPATQITSGQTITLGLDLPDGTSTTVTMRAVTAAEASGAKDEFVIGTLASDTAVNFRTALNAKLVEVGSSTLSAASTYAAAQNFFNAPGEPVLRVSGSPATATALRVATDSDTVQWYQGQTAAISADTLGRLGITTKTDTATLAEAAPVSGDYGYALTGITSVPASANVVTSIVGTNPGSVSVKFAGLPAAGTVITVAMAEPNGTTRNVALKAVSGPAGPGEFSISTDPNATTARSLTATAFSTALNKSIYDLAKTAEGNPRQSVTAQIDDNTKANYGMQANESGLLRMMRTLGAMSVETYPDSDPSSRERFDTMASRQQTQMSEGHNSERGSIEIMTMELGVAQSALQNTAARHTNYKAQLENLLSDTETVSQEETAVSILALQTRLQASYQVTSMVSKLSLVNFM